LTVTSKCYANRDLPHIQGVKNRRMRKEKEMSINTLISIFEHFSIPLKKHELLKGQAIDLEREDILRFYTDKNWMDVYTLRDNISSADLTFLSDKAIAKFLPAFLLYCIQEPDDADLLCDELVHLLQGKEKNKILRFLNLSQRDIVLDMISKIN